jgi:hypothetical protein
MLNSVWRAVDVCQSIKGAEHKDENFSLVRSLRDLMPREHNIDALVEISKQLGPTKRRQFLLFINRVRSLYRHYGEFDDGRAKPGDTAAELSERRKFLLINLRTH